LLHAGAADCLTWERLPHPAEQVARRLERWQTVERLVDSETVSGTLIGSSLAWRALLRHVVELATFSQAFALITGESGTGKELVARVIHELDPARNKAELVVVDCTTISPELSGSEFFGHERGSFTGALGARDGAFALAHGGTLLLDEIGELSLPLQAQLLRVLQERKYKRIGSNVWQPTEFRLIAATNRVLEAEVARGSFRADLYHRLAGSQCRTPPLRERRADILPLARHFLQKVHPQGESPELDPALGEYLLIRDYPGNVRELRQLMTRIGYRHTGPGPFTAGDLPEAERLPLAVHRSFWPDTDFENAIRHALQLGVGLKEIGQKAAACAMRIAIEEEGGNLQRAAQRLGVTDRALQIRRANRRVAE
jgi:transcriptional regulator with GAF, ATPase, and Fis domain